MAIKLSRENRLYSDTAITPTFGYSGENETDTLVIECESLSTEFTYYLDIEQNGKSSQALLTKGAGILTLLVSAGMLGQKGLTSIQVVMIKDTKLIDKSNMMTLAVGDSINASDLVEDFVPSEFEQFQQQIAAQVAAVPSTAEKAIKDYISGADLSEVVVNPIPNTELETILN